MDGVRHCTPVPKLHENEFFLIQNKKAVSGRKSCEVSNCRFGISSLVVLLSGLKVVREGEQLMQAPGRPELS